MVSNVKWFIEGYSIYYQSKDLTTTPQGLLNPVLIPATQFDIWFMNFIANLPVAANCNAVFTYIDKFIKHVYLTPYFVGEG